MRKCRVKIEIEDLANEPTMSWEYCAPMEPTTPFNLLGRAFEVAQRDGQISFEESLTHLFAGALIQKDDVVEWLTTQAKRKETGND